MRPEAQEILKDLGIREEAINTELADSSARAYAAAQIAVEKKKLLGEFVDGAYATYMAHVRRYARLFLKASDEKETLSSIEDTVVTLFSKATTDDQRKEYAVCMVDFLMASSVGKKELTAYIKEHEEEHTQKLVDLYKDCYRYQLASQYYDDYVNRKRQLEAEFAEAEALVEAYRQRAHCLVAIAANLRAAGDIDAYSLKQYSPAMVADIKRWVLKNPDVSPELLSQMAEAQLREKRESTKENA